MTAAAGNIKKFNGKKKKALIAGVAAIVAVAVIVAVLWGSGLFFKMSAGEEVYVQSVASLNSAAYGQANRFMGVVQAQNVEEIRNESGQTIDEIYVKEGDTVTAGTALFAYDSAEQREQLEMSQMDLDNKAQEIVSYQNQIAELQQERDKVSEGEKFEYTTEMQSLQLKIQEVENERANLSKEISEARKAIEACVVRCTTDGVIKKINRDSSENYNGEGAFITIAATGDYSVRGTVNEQQVASLAEGDPILVHSRVDDKVWHGSITKVDTDNVVSRGSEDMYAEEMSGENSSTNYYFYVSLDDAEGLILGQHLYLEPDQGQMEGKTGIWLSGGYIVHEDEDAYVWVANKRGRMEKRRVTLGKYDESLDEYEISEGLKLTEYIAFADESIREGAPAILPGEESEEEKDDGAETEDDGAGAEDMDDMGAEE